MDTTGAAPIPPAKPWLTRLFTLVTALPLLAVGIESGRVFFGDNRHVVIENRVYRCSQPDGDDLRAMVQAYGIKTVVNLRGYCPEVDWYLEEARASHELGLSQEDITLSAKRLPPPTELHRLIEVLDHCAYPIVIHCKAGADRTGLVATMILLLYTDTPLDRALFQLLPRYGHFRASRTAIIDEFFEYYKDWLRETNQEHSSERFRAWVMSHYQPGPCVSSLRWLDEIPRVVRADQSLLVRVEMINRSRQAWILKPGTFAGVHLNFSIFNEQSRIVSTGRRGLRDEVVPPGGSTVVAVPIHGLPPGRYKIVADIHDASGAGIPFRTVSFGQHGDESLAMDFTVK